MGDFNILFQPGGALFSRTSPNDDALPYFNFILVAYAGGMTFVRKGH